MAAAAAALEKAGGKVVIKEAARAVSERDDRLLAEKMEKLRTAQEEEDSDRERGRDHGRRRRLQARRRAHHVRHNRDETNGPRVTNGRIRLES